MLNLSLFAEDIIFYIEDPKEFTSLANCKIKDQLYFYKLIMNTENETNNSIYNNLQIIKCFGINLTREVQNLYTENYKILLKEIKEDINEKTSHVHGSEDLILLRW